MENFEKPKSFEDVKTALKRQADIVASETGKVDARELARIKEILPPEEVALLATSDELTLKDVLDKRV